MTRTATIPLARVFRSEIAQAKALGFMPQFSVSASAAAVRLVPITRNARTSAYREAPHLPLPVLESTVPFDHEEHRMDALRAAFSATIERAQASS